MGDAVNVSIPCLDPLETITVAGGLIHIHRISNMSSGSSSQPMALLLLHDLRNILSDQNISEQAALSRLSRLQKRFYTFEELGLMPPSCAVSSLKSKHELPDAVIKQIKTSSKANGMWFVTVDAALKIAFKFCTPQDAIRVSLDLSPFLAASYATSSDPLEVLESVNVDNLPKEFQAGLEQRMKEKKSKHRFTGSEAVDWLVKAGAAATRARAVEVATRMLRKGVFRMVPSSTGLMTASAPTLSDKSTDYYTFESDDVIQARQSGLLRTGSNTSSPSLSGLPHHAHPVHASSSLGFTLNIKKIGSGSRSNSSVSSRDQGSPRLLTSRGGSLFYSPGNHTPNSDRHAHLSQPFNVYILGGDRSGKTSVWSALTGKRPGNASVKATSDRPWNHVQLDRVLATMEQDDHPHQNILLSVWDFDTHQNTKFQVQGAVQPMSGLQSLPYVVHRAYVSRTPRCSALVVFDINSLDLVDMDYWVASIVTHQPAAPIIIVGTHSDTVSAKTKSKIKLFVTARYAKVKNVRGYISISAKSSSDVDKLRTLLLQHSTHSLSAQIKRERPHLSLDARLEQAIEAVAQNLEATRLTGTTFIPLADIRADLLEHGVPEDQVEGALGYLSAFGSFIRMPETLDQFTNVYGKPESDIKLWAILDLDYFFKLVYALNAAPPMLKMRGLISLSTVMEAWKAVEVPHEFMLDFMAYQYHMLRTTYCMVSLLINTVIQEKALAQASREEVIANHAHSVATKTKPALPTTSTARLTSAIRPAPLSSGPSSSAIQQKVLARVPNPDSHCFSLPAAIPRSFDQKVLGWAKVGQNELVRVYAFERLPGQMLERACIQLVLAVLTQLRTPFLPKNEEEKKQAGEKTHKAKKPKRRPSTPSATDDIKSNRAVSDSKVTHSAPPTSPHETPHRSVSTTSPTKRHRERESSGIKERHSSTAPASTAGEAAPVHRMKSEKKLSKSDKPKHKKSREKLVESPHSTDKEESTHGSSIKKKLKRGTSSQMSNPASSGDSTSNPPSPISSHANTPVASGSPSHSPAPQGSSPTGASPLSALPATQPSPRSSPRPASPARPKKDERSPERQALDAFSTKGSNELLQALQDIVCEHIEWTHQGISFTVGGENGFSARLYSIEGPQRETALVIRVTSETSAGSSRGLRLVLDNINAFVLWEYKNALSDVFIPCSCPDCLKARQNPKFVPLPVFKNAATFTFEECEHAIGSGFSTLPCSVYGNEVPLDSLVPDLVMSDLENFHAEYDEIVKEIELARSSNGIVYKGTYNGETVAIKEITVKLADGVVDAVASEYFADFRHEVWVSSLLKHENVVSLKAFAIKADVDETTGERIALLAIVMEFIPHGDLYDWIHDDESKMDWHMRLRIAEEVAEGLHFLHTLSPPILHHDLKSANIFIVDKEPDAPTVCRVGDFGEARTNFSYNSRERVDNPLWLAPEVMQKQRYEMWADVYAFGIIMWELVSRDHPFEEFPEGKSDFRSTLEDAIIGGLRPSINNRISPHLTLADTDNACIPLFAELMKECWQIDRFKRPTFARIISTLQDIRATMVSNGEESTEESHIDIQITKEDALDLVKSPSKVALSKVELEWADIVESVERAHDDGIKIATLQAASTKLSPRKSPSTAMILHKSSLASDTHPAASIPFNVPKPETSDTLGIPNVEKVNILSSASAGSLSSAASRNGVHGTKEDNLTDLEHAAHHQPHAAGAHQPHSEALERSFRMATSPRDATPIIDVTAVSPRKHSAPKVTHFEDENKQSCIAIPPPTADSFSIKDLKHKPEEAKHQEEMMSAKAKVLSTMQGIVAMNNRKHSPNSYEALLSTYAQASASSSKLTTSGSISRDKTSAINSIALRKRLAASAMIPISAIPDGVDHEDD